MIVWRVGHKDAEDEGFPSGPYTCEGVDPEDRIRLWGMGLAHSDPRHPSPGSDPALHGMDEYERCGCDSLDALIAWFDDWIPAIVDAGFIVWWYEVPEDSVRVGAYGQVVFDATAAEPLGTLPLIA